MDVKRTLAAVEGLEQAAMDIADNLKYIPIGQGEQRAVMMPQYLLPVGDIALFLAQLGYRRHPELALLKPRRIVGGVFEDLVTYVPVDEPGDPVVIPPQPYDPERQPEMSDMPWSVKPKVNETFEERPADD